MNAVTDAPVRIGLAGLGTVGSGLVSILERNADWIARRLGRRVVVKKVLVRDLAKPRAVALGPGTELTTDPDALVTDPDIDIVVELIGGLDAAFDLIHKALSAGKHVVSANKALLAERGPELFTLAAQKGLGLYYEASCAGAVPIVETLKSSLAGNRIQSIIGILNGTANYILSNMSDAGLSFADALCQAQAKGYAECDPTLDIQGIDAAHKLILLIRLAYGQNLPLSRLPVEGITRVTPEDIRFAGEFGYTIKLIGQVRDVDGKLAAGVYPMLVHKDFLLASVKGAFNAVRVEGDASGPIILHGKGAGDLPTGSAVLADILALAREGMIPNNTGFLAEPLPDADLPDPDEAVSPHYVHFTVKDQPGVMAAISKSMGVHGVSIRQAVQKGEPEDGYVPIVFLTHEAPTRAIKGVLEDAAAMPFIKPGTVHFRVL
ncbi:homoserine dehydrogenase [Solidesulfovibrio carbinoliphilus subsp. oakridgensis]|uniref:Homoserine dehydrogenase n=1 Tax=Solidesulfovibrio carbinoliphilus subsp. oakridgensis TaxID=694327 RepID=G7Q627_9BACT|nr:homoserine dehydrogenase [Solidesulfovibrio carbinoliphilus]EHJ47043.1 homoserine dehydrogenase [Solidesulfovibrio carbinoliphilus subsp. oakridgensis]